MARRATFIKQARAVEPYVLLLDGGNTLSSGEVGDSRPAGQLIVEAMNRMGYDALVLGELDLKLGEQALRQHMAEARFPILSANVKVEATGTLLCEPYAVVEVGGQQVGILGLTIPRTGAADSQAASPAGGQDHGSLTVDDPQTALAKYMGELRPQASVVIVLGNVDWESGVAMAESVPDIDLILSNGPSKLLTERWQSPETGTVVCALGAYHREYPTLAVNVLNLDVDAQGRVVEYRGDFFRLGSVTVEDPEIQALVDDFLSQ